MPNSNRRATEFAAPCSLRQFQLKLLVRIAERGELRIDIDESASELIFIARILACFEVSLHPSAGKEQHFPAPVDIHLFGRRLRFPVPVVLDCCLSVLNLIFDRFAIPTPGHELILRHEGLVAARFIQNWC
jgi:hypothetical protein